jgi:hypothetical protein
MIATDTIWTGLSGLLIAGLVVWACIRIIGGRR